MRLVLAAIIFKAGMGKLPVVDGWRINVKQLPLFLRYLVVLFEILGGVFMILGVKLIKS